MKWWKSEPPVEPSALALDEMEFHLSLWGSPDGVKGLTLKPTHNFGVIPRIGEEVTVTMRVMAITREER